MTKAETLSSLLLMWGLKVDDSGLGDKSFIHQVLTRKMEVFKTGIIVPVYLSAILEVGLEGNPGLSQLVLAEIIKNAHIAKLPYTITAEDFSRTFPWEFPNTDNPEFMEAWETKWDQQKKRDDIHPFVGLSNQVDTPDFWNNLVKQSMGRE